jgi:hypothetical protein
MPPLGGDDRHGAPTRVLGVHLDVYGHATPTMQKEATAAMERVMGA